MSDMIKLRQRFCKDCDIPVNIFDEPYFSDRLKLFDFLYNSVSKWDLFKSELTKYDSAMDYFADYSRIKDEARLKHGWVTVQGSDTVVTKDADKDSE